jgi:hypothetical protein
VDGGLAYVPLEYRSSIPYVSVIFLFFFNSKISRYVRDTYREVSGQYPVSEQYPIPVRQKSKVSALHSLAPSATHTTCMSAPDLLGQRRRGDGGIMVSSLTSKVPRGWTRTAKSLPLVSLLLLI